MLLEIGNVRQLSRQLAIAAAIQMGFLVGIARDARAQGDTFALYPQAKMAVDPNGFLLNPAWRTGATRPNIDSICRFRVRSGALDERGLVMNPNCLSAEERKLVSLNEASGALGIGLECNTSSIVGNVRGHVNWFPITVAGALYWKGFSAGRGDHDMTFDFAPGAPSLATSANDVLPEGYPTYHVEFYRDETLWHLPTSGSSFWHALEDASEIADDSTRDAVAHQLVDRRYAMITGLFNLDGVHGFLAELHPVYAMSVLVDSKPTTAGGVAETWAVLARNIGNQGDCSAGSIPLFTRGAKETQHLIIDYGWWEGADSAEVRIGQSWVTKGHDTTVAVRIDSGHHVFVDFPNRSPTRPRISPDSTQFLFIGTLTIEWRASRANPPRTPSISRLARQLPAPAATNPTLGLLPASGTPPKPGATLRVREKSGALQTGTSEREAKRRDSLNLLVAHQQGSVSDIAGWTYGDTTPYVYDSPPWIVQSPVTVNDCATGRAFAADRLCRGPSRYVIAYQYEHDLRPRGFVSYFLHAHNWPFEVSDGSAAEWLSLFAYRIDLSYDWLRRSRQVAASPFGSSDESLFRIRRNDLRGLSLRVSPILAPASFEVSNTLITPYSIISPGIVWTKAPWARYTPDRGTLTAGSGVGLHLFFGEDAPWYLGRPKGRDVFIEIQRQVRAHELDDTYALTFGAMFCWPFCKFKADK